MLLIVWHEESQLIAEAKKGSHSRLVSRNRELREGRGAVGVGLYAFIRNHTSSKFQGVRNLEFGSRQRDMEVPTAVENLMETILKSL